MKKKTFSSPVIKWSRQFIVGGKRVIPNKHSNVSCLCSASRLCGTPEPYFHTVQWSQMSCYNGMIIILYVFHFSCSEFSFTNRTNTCLPNSNRFRATGSRFVIEIVILLFKFIEPIVYCHLTYHVSLNTSFGFYVRTEVKE